MRCHNIVCLAGTALHNLIVLTTDITSVPPGVIIMNEDRVLKYRNGSVLLISLIVVLVLSVLSITVVSLTLTNASQTVSLQRRTEAHYLAMSGINVMLAMLSSDDFHLDDFQGVVSGLLREIESENSTFSVRETWQNGEAPQDLRSYLLSFGNTVDDEVIVGVMQYDEQELHIVSVGRRGRIFRTAQLIVEVIGRNASPFDLAVFADEYMSMGGSSSVTGTIGTNSVIPQTIVFSGNPSVSGTIFVGPEGDTNLNPSRDPHQSWKTVYHPDAVVSRQNIWNQIWLETHDIGNLDELREFLLPEFETSPENLEQMGEFTTPWVPGESYVISADGHYSKISITANRTLTIHTGDAGNVRRISVDELDITQGHIVLEGEGSLELYVGSSFKIGGGSTINSENDYERVTIYYGGDSKVSIDGAQLIRGTLFIKDAELRLTGSGGVLGTIITGGDKVTVTGAAVGLVTALYAPEATVSMTGSGKIIGAVIANRVNMSGNSSVVYDPDVEEYASSIIPGSTRREIKQRWRE